jgi:hypothetical protein
MHKMSVEFGTLYLKLLNGNQGVLPPNDLEAQLPGQDDATIPAEVKAKAKVPTKANLLHTASISLSAIQMGQIAHSEMSMLSNWSKDWSNHHRQRSSTSFLFHIGTMGTCQ